VEDPGRRGGAGSGRLCDGAYNAKEQQQHHHYVSAGGPRGAAARPGFFYRKVFFNSKTARKWHFLPRFFLKTFFAIRMYRFCECSNRMGVFVLRNTCSETIFIRIRPSGENA
jgi:hypothetical protein